MELGVICFDTSGMHGYEMQLFVWPFPKCDNSGLLAASSSRDGRNKGNLFFGFHREMQLGHNFCDDIETNVT